VLAGGADDVDLVVVLAVVVGLLPPGEIISDVLVVKWGNLTATRQALRVVLALSLARVS
jgi:hypothetical protein